MDNKYVDDFYEENGESIRDEEMVNGMEKPVATKQRTIKSTIVFVLRDVRTNLLTDVE